MLTIHESRDADGFVRKSYGVSYCGKCGMLNTPGNVHFAPAPKPVLAVTPKHRARAVFMCSGFASDTYGPKTKHWIATGEPWPNLPPEVVRCAEVMARMEVLLDGVYGERKPPVTPSGEGVVFESTDLLSSEAS
jgi:hypothetical protein